MYYANIKYCDIANGPGVRTSLFVSGCTHRCPGCFNEVAWDFGYGAPFTKEVRNQIFASCQPDYIAGLSLLGGEPMEPANQRELLPFVRNFKALYPRKTVWCYSGYTLEQLLGQEPSRCRCEATDPLLALLDVLTLGKEQAINLGVDYDRCIRRLLLGVTLCIAVATAMVGPISFLGLIIANLSRQLLKTFRHTQLVLGSALFGMIVLVGGQLIVEHVYSYSVPVSVFITVGGGLYFLYLLLTRKKV